MKKTTIILIVLCALCALSLSRSKTMMGNTSAQTKITYSLFTYKAPKGVPADNTDSSQRVYFKEYENNKYVVFFVWQKKTATATPASDYSAFINVLQAMYPTLNNQYDRAPTIKSEKGFDIVWQTAYAKAIDKNYKTEKEEPISIIIKVLRNKKQSAAVHIVTNDMDRAKGDIQLFLKSLNYKK